MTRPSLLFDENFGRPAIERLAEYVRAGYPEDAEGQPAAVIEHLFEFFPEGTPDEVWIPKIADENWVIVTADRGKRGGEKLPDLCVTYRVTHVLLSPSIHRRRTFDKMMTICSVWGSLIRLCEAPPGSRFALQSIGSRPEDSVRGVIREKFLADPEAPADRLFDPDNPP